MHAILSELLTPLARSPVSAYHADGPRAAEPTALAAMALRDHHPKAARQALDWLTRQQQPDGSIPTLEGQSEPGWTTSLAVLAWQTALPADRESLGLAPRMDKAVDWILRVKGQTIESAPYLGHDTMLVGWTWVDGTHSWLEPTALHLLALSAVGRRREARAQEAIRLLTDRQLPAGGCNSGNTLVLGQELRGHVQPTGMAMLALAGETDPRVRKSLNWLRRRTSQTTTSASLSWALMGLTAHDVQTPSAVDWIAGAAARTASRENSAYKRALLALAAQGVDAPPVQAVLGNLSARKPLAGAARD